MRTPWVLVFLLGTAPMRLEGQEGGIQFLSRTEASAAFTNADAEAYYVRLQLGEMRAKTGLRLRGMDLVRARGATERTYAAATEDFTGRERAVLRQAIAAMQPVIRAHAPLYARMPWSFIKIKPTIEGGLPFTWGNSIVLPDIELRAIVNKDANEHFDQPSELWSFLLHEQTHVLQRETPQLFVSLYTDVFGFHQARVPLPDSVRARSIIDPDAPFAEWIYPLGSGTTQHWVLPMVELRELNHPKMPADFSVVALRVHKVAGNQWAIDDDRSTAKQVDLASLAEYMDAFPVKDLAFHPGEIAGGMLGELLSGASKDNPQHELWAKTERWAERALR
jgi:hypothetical protein